MKKAFPDLPSATTGDTLFQDIFQVVRGWHRSLRAKSRISVIAAKDCLRLRVIAGSDCHKTFGGGEMPFLYSTRLFQQAEQFGTNIDLVGGKIATRVTRCRFPRGGVKWQTLSSGSLAIYRRNRLSTLSSISLHVPSSSPSSPLGASNKCEGKDSMSRHYVSRSEA